MDLNIAYVSVDPRRAGQRAKDADQGSFAELGCQSIQGPQASAPAAAPPLPVAEILCQSIQGAQASAPILAMPPAMRALKCQSIQGAQASAPSPVGELGNTPSSVSRSKARRPARRTAHNLNTSLPMGVSRSKARRPARHLQHFFYTL